MSDPNTLPELQEIITIDKKNTSFITPINNKDTFLYQFSKGNVTTMQIVSDHHSSQTSQMNYKKYQRQILIGHSTEVTSSTTLNSNNNLVTVSYCGTIILWERDAQHQDKIQFKMINKKTDCHSEPILQVISISDTIFATTSKDKKIIIWQCDYDKKDFNLINTFENETNAYFTSIAYSKTKDLLFGFLKEIEGIKIWQGVTSTESINTIYCIKGGETCNSMQLVNDNTLIVGGYEVINIIKFDNVMNPKVITRVFENCEICFNCFLSLYGWDLFIGCLNGKVLYAKICDLEKKLRFECKMIDASKENVNCLCEVSEDFVAMGLSDGRIKVYKVIKV